MAERRRAELAFCVIQMPSATAWVLVRLKKEKELFAGSSLQQCALKLRAQEAWALLKAVRAWGEGASSTSKLATDERKSPAGKTVRKSKELLALCGKSKVCC